jgi:hypothetical protein
MDKKFDLSIMSTTGEFDEAARFLLRRSLRVKWIRSSGSIPTELGSLTLMKKIFSLASSQLSGPHLVSAGSTV